MRIIKRQTIYELESDAYSGNVPRDARRILPHAHPKRPMDQSRQHLHFLVAPVFHGLHEFADEVDPDAVRLHERRFRFQFAAFKQNGISGWNLRIHLSLDHLRGRPRDYTRVLGWRRGPSFSGQFDSMRMSFLVGIGARGVDRRLSAISSIPRPLSSLLHWTLPPVLRIRNRNTIIKFGTNKNFH